MRVASIASFRERLDVLPDAVNSLLPQVDIVSIYFNEGLTFREMVDLYDKIDNLDKVRVKKLNEDRKDLSKFLGIYDYPDSLLFTCDDDLIYAPDYCDKMELAWEDSLCNVITCGGKSLKNPPYTTLKDAIEYKTHCLHLKKKGQQFPNLGIVHIPLTGCSMFLASQYQDCVIDNKYIGMADVQMFAWNVQMSYWSGICNNYDGYMMTYNEKMGKRPTIWETVTTKQTELIGTYLNEIVK
jgi:hypothetical protein